MNQEEMTAVGLWEKACAVIRNKIPQDTYVQWFESVVPVRLQDDSLVLGVCDEMFASWFENSYGDLIAEGLSAAAGKVLKFAIEAGHVKSPPAVEDECTETIPAISPAPEPKVVPTVAPNCQAAFTFRNFVVGEDYSAAMTAATTPGVFNPLYIYGSTGMGKTHLIQAVANHVIATNPDAVVRYVTCEQFLNSYLDSLHNKSVFHSHFEFRNYFREVDVLLIDDVHQLGGKEQLQEEFFNTFNTLHNAGKQIILTSDKQPSDIPGLEARLVTRFQSGVTTQITAPTYETRLSILQHEQTEQLKLAPEILQYIAARVSSSIRTLKGALMRLVAYASMTRSPSVPMAVAEDLLADLLDKEAESRKVTIDGIQKTVAEHFGLRVTDLTGSKRPKNIAEPRMVAMYLCRTLTGGSFPEIGAAFGRNRVKREHGQIKASVAKILKKVAVEADDVKLDLWSLLQDSFESREKKGEYAVIRCRNSKGSG